ncbi:MAG: YdbH domain-containing protein [Kiritimatiellae bacterium]|nr:YdbH domain-containing protein [Kiritimatiellia bacterium]
MSMETTSTGNREGKWAKRLIITVVTLLLVVIVLVLSVPLIIPYVPLPEIDFDASPYLKGKAAQLVQNHRVKAHLDVSRGENGGFRIRAEGLMLDWPFTATAKVGFGLVRAHGSFSAKLTDTTLRLVGDFDVKSTKDWRFAVLVPEARLSSDDAILGLMLPRLDMPAVTNLSCSGTLSLSADGECTPKRPLPSWSAEGSLSGVCASMDVGKKARPVKVNNLRIRFGAKGLADWREISPMFPHADSVEAYGVVLTNVFASIRATDRAYLVTEAGAGCAGGELKLYSLFLDPEKLSAGATIYADGVDAGEVLARVSGFRGEATGRLHGKLPFYLKDGKELRLRNAYLFSTPGETGKVRIADARPMLDKLAMGGVSEDVRGNLSKALANLDYTVLRVQLRRGEREEDSSLGLKLEGTASQGGATVPVNLNVTFRGDLDQLVNTGMKFSRR